MRSSHRGRARIVLILLVIELVLAFLVVGENAVITGESKRVGVALDWNELQGVAQAARLPVAELATALKTEGASYLVVREDTLARLEQTGRLQAFGGWELWQTGRLLHPENAAVRAVLAGSEFSVRATYLVTGDLALYERLSERLALRYGGEVRTWTGDNTYVLAVPAQWEQLKTMGAGVGAREVSAVRELGFEPVLAWLDGRKSAGEFKLDLADLTEFKPAMLLPGPLPPEERERVGRELGERGVLQGLPEFELPPGAKTVAEAGRYQAVRVYERPVHTIYQEYLLAVRDRNVRLVILHLLWQAPAEVSAGRTLQTVGADTALADANVEHLKRAVAAVRAGGFVLGLPQPFRPQALNPLLLATLLGLPAVVVLQFLNLSATWLAYLSLAVLGASLAAALLLPASALLLLRQAVALVVAGTVPALALVLTLGTRWEGGGAEQPVRAGVSALAQAGGITLAGALVVQALLGDSAFLLKLDVFLGIKLAYTITFGLIFLWAFRERVRSPEWWLRPLFSPLELSALAVLALLVWVLFNRSGNTSVIPIPAWELKARGFLEAALLVRPRTKEFLFGHPALVLAAAGWGRGAWWRPYLVVLAAVGQASLMNTFVHLHTPYLISLVRSLLGLVLGGLIGSLLTLAGNFLVRGGRRYA